MGSSRGTRPVPPVAKRVPHAVTAQGQMLTDPYHWLRERDNPEVTAYLEAENAYTASVMRHTEALQQQLYQEMVARIKETDASVPVKDGDYWYYSRTQAGHQYPIYCRKAGGLEAPEQILLDCPRLAEGHAFFKVGMCSVSPDHRLLAYAVDTSGSEVYTLQVKDLQTGQVLNDRLEGTAASAEWDAHSRTLCYVVLNRSMRPFKLFRHPLGRHQADDVLIFHERDAAYVLALHKTKDRRYFVLTAHSNTTSECHVLNAHTPEGSLLLVHPRQPGMEYAVEHHGDRFLILTNDAAPNFRLMEAPEGSPGKATWRDLLPHRPEVKLDGIEVFQDSLVVYEREGGRQQIRVWDLGRGDVHRVSFDEPVYALTPGDNPAFETQTLRFEYSSLVTPHSVVDYHVPTRRRELKKEEEIPSGYDRTRYASERIAARSHDGVSVPISLVYRRDLRQPGPSGNPLLLYGYGAYGSCSDPEFSSQRLSLLDRGVLFAIAHIRGGGDLGRPWYEAGKLLKKQNTFLDFIACAEHLIREGYTSAERLAIWGGSAGGLLMGAVINARPELFGAVIARVPFVDAVNTMLDPSLPLTVMEYEEWGNPGSDPATLEYLLTYSPYDNVKRIRYPHLLVTGGLHDPRVQYWEPAKWVAKLRAQSQDADRILLRMQMDSGHFGQSGRYDALRELAFEYAFLCDRLGVPTRAG